MSLAIAGIEIGEGHPCRFVAELSNSHNGDFDRAIRLIDAAKAAGADFVKTQCYTPDELVALRGDGPAPEPWGSEGFTMRTLYEKAQTPLAWFPQLFDYARSIGIVPFSSVFGLESLAMLERCACVAYKIAALDRKQHGHLATVASRGKPMFVSAPTFDYDTHNFLGAILLHCAPGYPTKPEDMHLPIFGQGYKNLGFIGLSSHCLDPLLPVAAAARGCKLIEMHLMLADEPSTLEANVSLNEYQFSQMIRHVRQTEVLLG